MNSFWTCEYCGSTNNSTNELCIKCGSCKCFK